MLAESKNEIQEFDVCYNECPIVNYNELLVINIAIYVVVCSLYFTHTLPTFNIVDIYINRKCSAFILGILKYKQHQIKKMPFH